MTAGWLQYYKLDTYRCCPSVSHETTCSITRPHRHRQREGQMDRQTEKERHRCIDRETDRHTDRWMQCFLTYRPTGTHFTTESTQYICNTGANYLGMRILSISNDFALSTFFM